MDDLEFGLVTLKLGRGTADGISQIPFFVLHLSQSVRPEDNEDIGGGVHRFLDLLSPRETGMKLPVSPHTQTGLVSKLAL
jgi:hypothetical protein